MNVCDCPWDSDTLGDCIMRDRVARTIPKSGNTCPNCGQPVKVGQECIDHAGLDCDGGGFFRRFHRDCFELMEMFSERLCGGGWHYPFDLVEASEHAVADGADPYWRGWLEQYEQTWAWTPEPPDPEPVSRKASSGSVDKLRKVEEPTNRHDVRHWREVNGE